jgi:hypothetical protein
MQSDKEYAIRLAMEYGFTGGFDAQGDLTFDAVVVEAILEAIAKEREACAKVCEAINAVYNKPEDAAERVASQWCADRIRERGEPTSRGKAI